MPAANPSLSELKLYPPRRKKNWLNPYSAPRLMRSWLSDGCVNSNTPCTLFTPCEYGVAAIATLNTVGIFDSRSS
jgi:hypothetical protein